MSRKSQADASTPAPGKGQEWVDALEQSYLDALLEQGEMGPDPGLGPPERVDVVQEDASEPAAPRSYWEVLGRCLDEGTVFDTLVVGRNEGGVLVQIDLSAAASSMSPELQEVTGFLPASQMIGLPLGLSRRGLQQRLDGRIGERVKVRLIELDPARERVVCSERAVSSNGTPASRLSQLSTMVGQSVEGTVRSIRGFGAFVDLGGVDGLLHVSKLGGERVRHPADVLHVGQAVQVEILSVDSEHGRVGLALKSFGPDPWAVVAERYSPGDLVEVEITTVRDFGAFARLPEGVEGLIHVSQLADGHFLHPRAVVAEGQYMTARVLDVDPQARRMGLSLRDVPLGL